MTFASGNLTQLRIKREATFGVTPTGNGKKLRCTDTSNLAFSLTNETSKEIRSDRQVSAQVLTGASATGAVPFELSYREYDDLMEATLQGAWVGGNDVAVASATIATNNTLTAVSGGTPFAGIVAGQKVKFAGFATAANNDEFTVLTATPTVLTVSGTPWTNEATVAVTFTSFGKTTLSVTTTLGTTLTAASGAPFVNVVAGQWIAISGMTTPANNGLKKVVSKTSNTVLVFAAATFANETVALTGLNTSRLSNGITQRSFSIEREHADITQFFNFRGLTPSKMSLAFASGAIVTGSFDFMGKDGVRAGTTVMGSAPAESHAYDIMNAVSGVGNLYEAGVPLTSTFIKSLSLDVDNALRAQDAIGTLGAVGIGSGTIAVSGNMEVYLADGTMYDKFVNNTASSVSWSAVDGSGNGYVFTLPNIKFNDAKVTGGSLNTDAMLSMPFVALMDATLLKTLIIDRVGV